MKRLLPMVFFVVIGCYIGFQLSLMNMRSQCATVEGTWTGTLCMQSEPSQ